MNNENPIETLRRNFDKHTMDPNLDIREKIQAGKRDLIDYKELNSTKKYDNDGEYNALGAYMRGNIKILVDRLNGAVR